MVEMAADKADGIEENEPHWGRVYVTRRCCGAGGCRNLAPELFAEV